LNNFLFVILFKFQTFSLELWVVGEKLNITPIRLHLICDGTCSETSFGLLAQRTSPFNSVGASVQSITGNWVLRISGSNAGYTMFQGSMKGTGYPLHSPVSPLFPLPCVTVCHHVSTGLYHKLRCVEIKSIFHWIDSVQWEVCFISHGVSQPGFCKISLGDLQI
jgi:hypothetical protein